MEMEGLLDKLTREDLNALCAALNEAADTFLEAAVKESLALDVRDLPVMTLGAYADGHGVTLSDVDPPSRFFMR